MYSVRVRAVNQYGPGVWSALYEITSPGKVAPLPVTGLTVRPVNSTAIRVTWNTTAQPNDDGECWGGGPS